MEILKSKKFQAAIVGMVVVIAAKYGLELDEQAVLLVLSPILMYIGAQGISDKGKEQEKIANEARKDISANILKDLIQPKEEE